jgi:hypothetical protein
MVKAKKTPAASMPVARPGAHCSPSPGASPAALDMSRRCGADRAPPASTRLLALPHRKPTRLAERGRGGHLAAIGAHQAESCLGQSYRPCARPEPVYRSRLRTARYIGCADGQHPPPAAAGPDIRKGPSRWQTDNQYGAPTPSIMRASNEYRTAAVCASLQGKGSLRSVVLSGPSSGCSAGHARARRCRVRCGRTRPEG